LQAALDTYGSVRLEKGDYSGINLVMTSNQKLYGHPSTNNISSITIKAGSTNVYVESLKPQQDKSLEIYFQAGAEISNCTFKTLKYVHVVADNAKVVGNTFIDITGNFRFDCSVSGYFRNNRIIKHQSQGNSEMMVMKGNRNTPSYGNVNFHNNYLGSQRQTTDITNLETATFIGTDCEAYGGLTREMFYVNNVDKLKSMVTNGASTYNPNYGYSNIDASYALLINDLGGAEIESKISSRSGVLAFSTPNEKSISGILTSGYQAKTYNESADRELVPRFFYKGVELTQTIADPSIISKLTNTIVSPRYAPWSRPVLNTAPDPLGANWRVERVGKLDSRAYIQNLINTNGVADLPEGIFYISGTLNVLNGAGQGITGRGTGKTVICGLTDDFPLISVNGPGFGAIDLGYLTLQGGNCGVYVTNPAMMVSYQSTKFVVFRDQQKALHYRHIFGLDNCFFENLIFINCANAIVQEADPVYNPDLSGSTYFDKLVFYRSQFINSNKALLLSSIRASNLNAWIDCKFDGGEMAADMRGDTTFFANCDFTNFTGNYTLRSNMFNLISCNFYNNSNTSATIYSAVNYIEGCTFLDNVNLASPIDGNPCQLNLYNSIVTGNALVKPVWPNAIRNTHGMYVNSTLLSNPSLSKLMVRTVNDKVTVFLNEASNPYPQFLVTQ